jgi:hypothetical protein
VTYDCGVQPIMQDTMRVFRNVFYLNRECTPSGDLFHYGEGATRARDAITEVRCTPTPESSPCPFLECDDPDCLPFPVNPPGLGGANRELDPLICNSAQAYLHCNSFALAANNPWNVQIGWTPTQGCGSVGCGGGSCPFVSVWDGARYLVDNNILPRSERVVGDPPYVLDRYPLRYMPSVDDGLIRLRLSEFEREVSYVDEVKLFAVDVPAGVDIATSDDGSLVFYEPRALPTRFSDSSGVDLTCLMQDADSIVANLGEDGEASIVFSLVDAFGKEGSHLGGSSSLPKSKQVEDPKMVRATGRHGTQVQGRAKAISARSAVESNSQSRMRAARERSWTL